MRVPGGAGGRNGLRLHVYGAPQFRPGGEALLFLRAQGDGSYAPLHLMLGAFHEVRAGAGKLALRHLADTRALTIQGAAPRPEPVRDANRFAAWIAARAAGRDVAPDYELAVAPQERESITEEFTLFESGGRNLRWFEFDTAGGVTFLAHTAGQAGVPGGGFNEFQQGLAGLEQRVADSDQAAVRRHHLGPGGAHHGRRRQRHRVLGFARRHRRGVRLRQRRHPGDRRALVRSGPHRQFQQQDLHPDPRRRHRRQQRHRVLLQHQPQHQQGRGRALRPRARPHPGHRALLRRQQARRPATATRPSRTRSWRPSSTTTGAARASTATTWPRCAPSTSRPAAQLRHQAGGAERGHVAGAELQPPRS